MEEVEGKLANHLVPLHYSLHLNPNLTTFTFTGKVAIDLELRKPTDRILVNAKQLKVEAVTLTRDEVEVEEEEQEEEQRTRESSPSHELRSPAKDDEDGGGRDDHQDGSGEENNGDGDVEEKDEKDNNDESDKIKDNRGLKVSHLQKEWDDEEEEEEDSNAEEDVVEKAASGEEDSVNGEENGEEEDKDSNNSKDGEAIQINSGGNGDVFNGSDDSNDSSDSISTGAVKRKSANDSTDGLSDVKYKKADDDSDEEVHWSSRAPLKKWSGWKDDEVYAVPDDDDEEDVTQADGAGELGEDIVQVDGADSLGEDGEEPWNLVKTSKVEVGISSFEVLEAEEVLEINLLDILQPCHLTLNVTYSGTLDDSMRGFYRTRHPDGWGAACHFEATGARKCFPCIDQPEFRSTFDISVTRPSPCLTVLSNMPAVKEDVSSEVVTFARTPEMPTYLICVIVGHYSSLSHRTQGGVPVSVFTPCGRTR